VCVRFGDIFWALIVAWLVWLFWVLGNSPTVALVVGALSLATLLFRMRRSYVARSRVDRSLTSDPAPPAAIGVSGTGFRKHAVTVWVERSVVVFFAVTGTYSAVRLASSALNGDTSIWGVLTGVHVVILWALWHETLSHVTRVVLYPGHLEANLLFRSSVVLPWSDVAVVAQRLSPDVADGRGPLYVLDVYGELRITLEPSLRPFPVLTSTIRERVGDARFVQVVDIDSNLEQLRTIARAAHPSGDMR